MNISTRLASRYVFGKKSTNVINIITAIAVFGIAVGTAALILVLSVFNGFEDLISGLFHKFNPDLKVMPASGKTFPEDTLLLSNISRTPGVAHVSRTLEELALLEYNTSQTFANIKGVDNQFDKVSDIANSIIEGEYLLGGSDSIPAIYPGVGVAQRLAVNIDDFLSRVQLYVPKKHTGSPLETPFTVKSMVPEGIFAIQQEFDQEYALISLADARQIFGYTDALSALEIKLDSTASLPKIQEHISRLAGDKYVVKNRFQQDEAFLKLMNIEKWMSYAIVCLTLLLVAFNMVGALWIIVLDKRRDIALLKAMGLNEARTFQIFLRSGILLSVLGMAGGFIIALILYYLQEHYALVKIPDGFVVNRYPVSIRWMDFVVVGLTVLVIGLLSSIPAANKARYIATTIIND